MNHELFLNKEFYSLDAIYKACSDYRHITSIQVKDYENYYLCYLNDCRKDFDLVKNEFSNYVLALTVKLKRYMEE